MGKLTSKRQSELHKALCQQAQQPTDIISCRINRNIEIPTLANLFLKSSNDCLASAATCVFIQLINVYWKVSATSH